LQLSILFLSILISFHFIIPVVLAIYFLNHFSVFWHFIIFYYFLSFFIIFFCVPLYIDFDVTSSHIQFVNCVRWFSLFEGGDTVYYYLGVDGFSILFIFLTCFTNLIVILSAWNSIKTHTRQYMSIFLVVTGLTNGVFCSQDTILFYSFWEFLLIPTTLGIGIWGGKNKAYASIKYFLYTFSGSIFLLISFLYIQKQISLGIDFYLVNLDTFSIQNFIYWSTQIGSMGFNTIPSG
jgi:NADH-quinone oxidoreductase subunit M